ncbi:MAG: ATP-binding protein [Alphaproteobacteria bacterium]
MNRQQWFLQSRDNAEGTARMDADAPAILASNTPSTPRQRSLAWAIVATLCIVFVAAAPYLKTPLPHVYAFLPVAQAILCVADLITAAFVFSQYAAQPQRALLALAAGYVLSGLIAFLQTIAFPGAYSPAGLLGGINVAPWLYCLWNTALPLGVFIYAATPKPATTSAFSRRTASPIAITLLCTLTAACVLTWGVMLAEPHLPPLAAGSVIVGRLTPYAPYAMMPAALLSLAALALLLVRGRTILDLWLVVTVVASLPNILVPILYRLDRFTLGFYLGRSYALLAGCTVLIALLTETATLYTRLASASALRARGETDRLSSVEAATAAMAHELRQPLTAVAVNSEAVRVLLRHTPPDLAEVRAAVADIIESNSRAANIISSIRHLLKRDAHTASEVQINELVRETLALCKNDLQARGISVSAKYASAAPCVSGDRNQLQQVLSNLIMNAVDSMQAQPPGERNLRLTTTRRGDSILVSVQDSGPGISTDTRERVFDPFFTTKAHGLGLGLAICKSIVQEHQGDLRLADSSDGCVFEIALPASTITPSVELPSP